MIASNIMVRNPVTATVSEPVGDVLHRMRSEKLRMLPVIDETGCVQGVLSTFAVMEHIVPDYIVSGDLESVPYVPELGLLGRAYCQVAGKTVAEVMDPKPLLVGPNEELLSVAAAMISYGKHEYALVADLDKQLLGVISAGDVLDCLARQAAEGVIANA